MSQETAPATRRLDDAELSGATNDTLRWLEAGGYNAAHTVFICATAIAAVSQMTGRNAATAALLRVMADVIERGEAVSLVTAP